MKIFLSKVLIILCLIVVTDCVMFPLKSSHDADVMIDLKKALVLDKSLNWSDPSPCKWEGVFCTENRVSGIQFSESQVKGEVPSNFKDLSMLKILVLQGNALSGVLPICGMTHLETVLIDRNYFSSVPSNCFNGLTNLRTISLDHNPFTQWEILASLVSARDVEYISIENASLIGKIPKFLRGGRFPLLKQLNVANNRLEGPVPTDFATLPLTSLQLNGQKFNGDVFLSNMSNLSVIRIENNFFSGPLPNMSMLRELQELNLARNKFSGPVPSSLTGLINLGEVNLSSNYFQGPIPTFNRSMDFGPSMDNNSFVCWSRENVTLGPAFC